MARKKEYNYFESLAKLSIKAEEAARLMNEMIHNYESQHVIDFTNKVHTVEREADMISREILNELNHSFVTPIDREDIVLLTEYLDNIVDGINGLTYLFDTYVITDMRENTLKIAGYVVEATEGVVAATKEFAKFKHSKTLKTNIDQVNEIEEKTDELYRALIKDLILNEKDVMNVIKWKNIYEGFETVINATERAADTIYGLVIKNS